MFCQQTHTYILIQKYTHARTRTHIHTHKDLRTHTHKKAHTYNVLIRIKENIHHPATRWIACPLTSFSHSFIHSSFIHSFIHPFHPSILVLSIFSLIYSSSIHQSIHSFFLIYQCIHPPFTNISIPPFLFHYPIPFITFFPYFSIFSSS